MINHKIINHKKGFTLIETLIYIALFSILMGGALVTSYGMIEGTDKIQIKSTIQEEGNFVLRKIDWALSGVATITTPSSGYSDNLSVTKYDGTEIYIQLNSLTKKIEMKEGSSGTFRPLTTDNVQIDSLQFHFLPASGASPAGIEASTTIMDLIGLGTSTFYTKKYIRK